MRTAEDSSATQGIAIFLSLVALILSAWNLWSPTVSASELEGPAGVSDKRLLQKMKPRLLSIEKRIIDLESKLTKAKREQDARNRATRGHGKDWEGELTILSARLALLEKHLQAREGSSREKPKTRKSSKPSPIETLELTTLRSRAVNAGLPPFERLEMLRRLRIHMAPKARSTEVIAAFIELARGTEDANIRRAIWTQMKGANDNLLVQALIKSLENDADAGVREQAASTLDDYDDQADVRVALEHAKRFDKSAKVRQQAKNSLQRKQ